MSEDLLGRADSLMRRSRTFVAGHAAQAPVDDGIPLLTDEVDLQALIAPPEPPDRTEEITAAVTAEVTQRVTGEVTAAVTEEVTRRVTAEVTERVARETTAEVTQRVTAEVTARVRDEALQTAQRATADALAERFADLAGLIQSLIDDWSSTTLPALVSIEIQAAMEQAISEAAGKATARIREQAVLDLRDSIAGEIEARCAALSVRPSEGADQPL